MVKTFLLNQKHTEIVEEIIRSGLPIDKEVIDYLKWMNLQPDYQLDNLDFFNEFREKLTEAIIAHKEGRTLLVPSYHTRDGLCEGCHRATCRNNREFKE